MTDQHRWKIEFSAGNSGAQLIQLSGSWFAGDQLPQPEEIFQKLNQSGGRKIVLDAQKLEGWDSGLIIFIRKTSEYFRTNEFEADLSRLPQGIERLLKLASASTKGAARPKAVETKPLLEKVGLRSVELFNNSSSAMRFIGEFFLALLQFARGKARVQFSNVIEIIQRCGPEALPIVSLISALVGLIVGFIGSIQLAQFGAQIYVANMVGIAMVREMGAIMAAIILAGRTGAAFAAQLGTMEVNEEIDALKTFGISPMEFLVLPRVFALVLMLPLLCLYADLLGIIGGALIGVGMHGISPILYWDQTISSISMESFMLGITKSIVFGVLVAMAGCYQGMKCGRSAAAVGIAVTSAVVSGIVLIVVTDAVFAVACEILGI